MDAKIIYRPLDLSRKEIRLLEVHNTGDDTVDCTLITVFLDDKPLYTALSYFWGDPTDKRPITLNGIAWEVTVNLYTALRNVRSHWQTIFPGRQLKSFRMWADALCLN